MSFESLIKRQTAQLDALTLEQLRAIAPLFQQARQELGESLAKSAGGQGGVKYTAALNRTLQAAATHALRNIAERLADRTLLAGLEAQSLADQHLLQQLDQAINEFGVPRRIQIAAAARTLAADGTLLERTARYSDTWTKAAVASAKAGLAKHLLKQSTMDEVLDDLTKPGGILENNRYAAQRLVRTETAFHYNRRTHEALTQAAATDPNVRKRLHNIIDNRTARDTLAIIAVPNNLVKPVDEPFQDPWYGKTFLYPPNRPNDRARITFFYNTEREQAAVQAEQQNADELLQKQVNAGPGTPPAKPKPPKPPPATGQRIGPWEGGKHPALAPRPKNLNRPGTIRVGEHYRRVQTHRSGPTNAYIARRMQVLSAAGYDYPLAVQPLGTILMANQRPSWFADDVIGIYYPDSRMTEIYTGPRQLSSHRWGRSWSMSNVGTIDEAIENTVLHETGHHFLYRFHEIATLLEQAIASGKLNPGTIYATAAPKEYFAETLVLYHRDRNALKRHDPQGYQLIADARKVLGL